MQIQRLLCFGAWKTIINGRELGEYQSTGLSFKAYHEEYPTDKIQMRIEGDALLIEPLSDLSQVLVFSEGQLVHPPPRMQHQAAKVILNEEATVMVMLFASSPHFLRNRLDAQVEPLTLTEFEQLIAGQFNRDNCTLLRTEMTKLVTDEVPSTQRGCGRGVRNCTIAGTTVSIVVAVVIIIIVYFAVTAKHEYSPVTNYVNARCLDNRSHCVGLGLRRDDGWYTKEIHACLGVECPYTLETVSRPICPLCVANFTDSKS